ncbi:MAG: phosphatase PAP2 family protein [Pirellulales bacterium]|nr:phosphatase PAP2 family protein [Pirellulales bacterium]
MAFLAPRPRTRLESFYKPESWQSLRTQLLWLLVPLGLTAAGFLALAVDVPLSHWCVEKRCPLIVRDLLDVAETFGNGWGVALIGLTLVFLAPGRRWAVPRILGCAYGAGMAANGVKLLLERIRPLAFDFSSGIAASFGQWLPGTGAGSMGQSFPSAHTATAVAFAAALSWLFPHGRWWLFFLAAMVGCQRIQSGNHFPSDVLWGAALGSLIALCFFKIGRLPVGMDWLECRMRKIGSTKDTKDMK